MNDDPNRIFTIPNILSLFRILLIPIIVWLYVFEESYYFAAGVIVLSALTDVVDGMIARRFNMVSNVGRVLDPIADKLTQLVVLFCLCFRFRKLLIPLVVLALKEVVGGIFSLIALKKSKTVPNARWYGKAATVVLYITIFIHLVWPDLPNLVSDILIALSVAMMLLSFVLYTINNIRKIKSEENV